jgi:hypothetical protein
MELGGKMPNLAKNGADRNDWLSVSDLHNLSNNFCSITTMRKLVVSGVFGKVLRTFNALYVKKISDEEVMKRLIEVAND